ncbi:hypothetical protein ACH5RR_010028 [Cinchona calisaya]|uniref:Tify domain-containing protein n=1 Tax=Cinchona calisaya TaxID=153742 RepID=A0ABD3AFX9_9GENT
MSFQDKGFWMPKGGGHLSDAEAVFSNSSRTETKRTHQWFAGAAEPEIFPNKKQAVQVPIGKPTSIVHMASNLAWENGSGFQSVPNQFMDRLFGSDTTRSVNSSGQNISPLDVENSGMRKEVIDEQYGDSSVGLSMSYPLEDTETCVSYGGIRKVKVNQVRDSENGLHEAMEHNIGISLDQAYNRETETAFISMGQAYGKEGENVTLTGHSYNRAEASMRPVDSTFSKGDDNAMSLAHDFCKGNSNSISFGGYQGESLVDALARPVSSYDLLYNQSSIQASETLRGKVLDASNATAVVSTSQMPKSKPDSPTKKMSETKPARKEALNSFPSNVRSLIATGMLDGVLVRYVSVSREELRGIIKGSGYLCGCHACNYSKALNAYEFERHAGCKTKHPNNHIYFENGKTIYQIVQELRSTPESSLFDAIETVTGSPINQKAFRIWKESFQAATRELQRIYGKEELNL